MDKAKQKTLHTQPAFPVALSSIKILKADMAMFNTQVSKFRNVVCQEPKPQETWTGLRLSAVSGEQSYIKANGKWMAFGVAGGGGPFTVLDVNKPGRIDSTFTLQGHTGPVIDFDFNPFNDDQLVSCSEDSSIKLWNIPKDGLSANIDNPTSTVGEHPRKVTAVRYHPTANGVLASTGMEHAVKIWDVEKSKEISCCADAHKELIQDIAWDWVGSTFATSCKDRTVRIVDARSAAVVSSIPNAHDGSKAIKLTYLGDMDKLLTTGFVRGSSKRQMKIWDPKNLSAPLCSVDLESASGVIMPFFDNDTRMVYLADKGASAIKYFEILDDKPHYLNCAIYRGSSSMKGAAFVPKRSLDIARNEVARIIKLTINTVESLSFHLPRRSETFQDDLFPDTVAGVPSMTCTEWLAGENRGPMVKALDPSRQSEGPRLSESKSGSSSAKYVAPKSSAELQGELDAAKSRISYLEEKLKAANISY